MKKLFIYIFVLLSSIVSSQEMIIDWDECFGGSNTWSRARAIEVLSNSNIITSITIHEYNEAFTNYHGDTDEWVLILDSSGNIIQDRCFFWGG